MYANSTSVAVILILAFAGLIGISGQPAVVQESEGTAEADSAPPRFGIYPIGDFPDRYFKVEIEAGTSMQLTAGISNVGTELVSLRTFATNAFNPPNGGFAAATEQDKPNGPTLWLDYPSQTIELGPDEQWMQDFTVVVPPDTDPGQYVAALVVRTEGSLPIPGSAVFEQVIRGAVSVDITVPGPVASSFELGKPEISSDTAVTSLDIPIKNTGNVLIQPEGIITLSTPSGEKALTASIKMESVYGGLSTIVRVILPEQFPIGDYLVSLELTDPETGASDSIENAPVTITPPATPEPEPVFVVDEVSITPSGDPIRYADVATTITNNGRAISTANVTLNVQHDGEEVESYPLAENVELPTGGTTVEQRYIPVDGWQPGTWTFELVVSAVSGDTETFLATIDVEDKIVVP